MLENVNSLRAFVLEECSVPYQCMTQTAEAGPSTVGPRMAVDIDLMHLVDAWPEAADLMFSHPLDEVLRIVKNEIVTTLKQNPRHFSLRPLHVPPTIPSAITHTNNQYDQRGQTVVLVGTIVRIFSKRVVPYLSHMRCPRCTKSLEIYSDPFDRGGNAKQVCPN